MATSSPPRRDRYDPRLHQDHPNPDPWNTAYKYQGVSSNFAASSWGKGGASDTAIDLGTGNTGVSTGCFECDIIFIGDNFSQKPKANRRPAHRRLSVRSKKAPTGGFFVGLWLARCPLGLVNHGHPMTPVRR